MDTVKVVGLGGSLKEGSASLVTLELALAGARDAGAEVELLDVRLLDLPFYVPGLPPPPGALRLTEAVGAAHGLIWSSPVYHGSISGSFKNALDWLELLAVRQPPYLSEKVVGLISTAGGVQGLQAINTMEFVVRALRGWTAPFTMPVERAGGLLDAQGQGEQRLAGQLRYLGAEVARAAARLSAP